MNKVGSANVLGDIKMRLIGLILVTMTTIILTACGNGFSSSNRDLTSLSTTTPIPTPIPAPTPAPTLNEQQRQATQTSIASLVGKIFVSIQNLNQIDFTVSNQTVSANLAVNCPSGGSVAILGQAGLNLSVTGFTMNSDFSQVGAASVTFFDCQIPGDITIDGTVNVSNVAGNMAFVYNAIQGTGTMTTQGSDQVIGNLQVSSGSLNLTCPLSITNSVSLNGNGAFASGSNIFTVSGNGTATINGSFCGSSVTQQATISL